MSLSVDSTYAQFNITSTTVKISKGKTTFLHGFISALTLVFLSEFGDRTFFLTAILSINHSRITTFIAALTALLLNSILACGFGVLASNVPKVYIHYLSIVLFTAFGLKTIYDGNRYVFRLSNPYIVSVSKNQTIINLLLSFLI